MRPSLRLSPRRFEWLAAVAAAAVAFIIVTGAAVRLTGSGLGCTSWPTCTRTHVVAPLALHPWVEFGNRLVTGVVSVVVVLAVGGALVREPRRRDLTWLAAGLVVGVVAQIVLGGLAVLADLAPPFVMAHFLLSMALLLDALVLHHRAGIDDLDRRTTAVPAPARALGRIVAVLAAAVLAAGTVVTSTGPHGGDPKAPRFHLSLHRVAQVHGSMAMLLLAAAVALVVVCRRTGSPTEVQRRAQQVVEALAAQVGLGYAQYFTGVPALLVLFHVAGAVVVWTAVARFVLACDSEPGRRSGPPLATAGTAVDPARAPVMSER